MAKKLEVVLVANPKGLSSGFGEAEARAGRFESKMTGISRKVNGTFGTIGKGLGVGAAAGVGLLASYGPTLVDLGGKLGAWQLKADTVFEDQAASVRKWADKNNESFGMTDEELTGLAAGFGDLLKPMGFSAKEAADMSKKVVGLSGALSQWSGGTKSSAKVTDILAKAMLGEREGLKELGISISEADVQARLAKKGQEGLTGAALEQAKALATQELIFEKSTDAQAAYAKGGNKTLMASNKLKAIFGELQVWLAEKLVPAFTKVATWVGDNLPRYIAIGQAAIESLFGGGGGDAGSKAQEVFGRVREAVEVVVAAVREKWPQIKQTVSEVMTTIQTVVSSVLTVVRTIWTNFGENILTAVRGAWNNIRQTISGQLEIIRGIFTTIAALFQGDWGKVWEGIKMIVHGAFDSIVGIVKNAGELLRLAAEVTLETLNSVWKAGWDGIQEIPRLAWEGIKVAVAWGAQWVVDRLTELPGKIRTATAGLFDGIKDAFRGALNRIIRKWNDFELKLPSYDGLKVGGQTVIPGWEGPTLGTPNLSEFRKGGITPAHITRDQLFKYGEPATGGEAFVPRKGDKKRSMSILGEAASWYGAAVVPMANGGVIREDEPGWDWRTMGNRRRGPVKMQSASFSSARTTVTPYAPKSAAFTGAPITINVYETRDAQATAREVASELRRLTRMGGSPLAGVGG